MFIKEDIRPLGVIRRQGIEHDREDQILLARGILDFASFLNARELVVNPVMIEVHDKRGRLKYLRYTNNLRTNDGIDWQARQMGGGPTSALLAATGFVQNTASNIAITAPTGTTAGKVTDTNANITINTATLNQFIGCLLVYADGSAIKCAHIVGNSASGASSVIWYFDNWFSPSDWSATAAAPLANKPYMIASGGGPAFYVGLSTNSGSQLATDHTIGNVTSGASSEIGSGFSGAPAANGLGRVFAAAATNWTHNAGVQAYILKNTFTASGPFTAVQQCGMFTAISAPGDAAADLTSVGKGGGVMAFENTFTSVNLVSSDTLTITWTVSV